MGQSVRVLIANLITVVVNATFCLVAAVLVLTNPTETVKFDCGRKATFGDFFATSLYVYEIFGFVAGLIMNVAAYLRTRSITQSKNVREQLKRLRYYATVAAISTMLVAVPNLKQLFIGPLKGFKRLGCGAKVMISMLMVTDAKASHEFRVEFMKYLCIFKQKSGNHMAKTVVTVAVKPTHYVHMKSALCPAFPDR
ncbi:hypothetical protein GCK32_010468 [Trichostrongylus colubriformis]|uniref:7TM GPCR serpentine receptor class x (Srx) domain-containing protein n=1 Tax=Trichostrongylus colubriformis TaxID=6319 RepID=A0AAN8FRA0_TRICO